MISSSPPLVPDAGDGGVGCAVQCLYAAPQLVAIGGHSPLRLLAEDGQRPRLRRPGSAPRRCALGIRLLDSPACRGVQTPEKTRVWSQGLLCEKWLANLCSAKSHAELVHSKRAVVTLVAGKGKQRRADSSDFCCPFLAGVAFFASAATIKPLRRGNNQSHLPVSSGFYLVLLSHSVHLKALPSGILLLYLSCIIKIHLSLVSTTTAATVFVQANSSLFVSFFVGSEVPQHREPRH